MEKGIAKAPSAVVVLVLALVLALAVALALALVVVKGQPPTVKSLGRYTADVEHPAARVLCRVVWLYNADHTNTGMWKK